MNVSWPQLKAFIIARKIPVQWIDIDDGYCLKAFDGYFELSCNLAKDGGSDVTEFESSYKAAYFSAGVPSLVQAAPAIGSKTILVNGITKKLFARNTGMQFSVAAGSTDLFYTATYDWAKVLGVEVVNCEALDTGEMRVYDTASGQYSGVPDYMLNQFGYTMNFPAGFYSRSAPFDADLYKGMKIKITYVSQSAKTVGVNFIMNEVK